MHFQILGPLAARHGGVDCPLGGARQRAVLAALLLRANRVASVSYLAEATWACLPAAPMSNLRTYITGLRRCLPDGHARILTRPSGYVLVAAENELDLTVFERHRAAGDAACRAGDPCRATQEYRRALTLWQGSPLEGLTGGVTLAAEVARLTELRLSLVERSVDARLALGQHADLIAELRTLIAVHPLREQLWTYLLRALHGCDRRADALLAYQEVHRLLDSELGVRPGRALRELHGHLLVDGPVLL